MRFDHGEQDRPAAPTPATAVGPRRNRRWSWSVPDLSRWHRRGRGPTVHEHTAMATAQPTEPSIPRWQRSLLPAVLGADHADRGGRQGVHLPRTLRDWVVDLIMFGFSLALGAAGAWQNSGEAPGWWIAIDVVIGLAVCGALWVRRHHPLA